MSFILKRRDLCMYCGFNGIRQARTIRRLRSLADGYRARRDHVIRAARTIGVDQERARIVAAVRRLADTPASPTYIADAIERGEL